MCTASIYDARNNLSALIKTAENGEPVQLTRHDKPVAVILSWEDFENRSPKKAFLTWLKVFTTENEDILSDGLPLPPKEYPDENYENKMKGLWG